MVRSVSPPGSCSASRYSPLTPDQTRPPGLSAQTSEGEKGMKAEDCTGPFFKLHWAGAKAGSSKRSPPPPPIRGRTIAGGAPSPPAPSATSHRRGADLRQSGRRTFRMPFSPRG